MKKIDLKHMLLMLVSLVLTIAVCFVIAGCEKEDNNKTKVEKGSATYQDAIDTFLNAYLVDFDADALINVTCMDVIYIDSMDRERSDEVSAQENEKAVHKLVKERKQIADRYESYKASWVIKDVNEVEAEVLADIQKDYDKHNIKLQAVNNIWVQVHYEFDHNEDDEDIGISLAKIDGRWFVVEVDF